jgi:tRNA threonylcarbamoyladenosine biosynthesis protein TsaB
VRSVLLILAVHSTTPVLGVACVEDDRALGEAALAPGRRHLENLAPLIKDLTGRLNISLTDVDGFGVALGPGSFSGTRIGLATIKGIALALGKPVAGISCLDILAWQGLEEGETGTSVIDAKRGQLYAALYKKNEGRLVLLDGPMLVLADELSDLMMRGRSQALVTEDVGRVGLGGPAVTLRSASPSARACALLAFDRLSRGAASGIHSLHPLYIRRSDAEEKKKASV